MRAAFLLAACAIGWASSASAMSEARMKIRTIEIAHRYLATWSLDDPVDAPGVPYVYGETVNFLGRTYDRPGLAAEKRLIARRLQPGRYAIRPGTIRVSCNVPALKCAFRSTVEFRASGPPRQPIMPRSSRFDLGVAFDGPKPRIVYEDGAPGIASRE